MNVDECELMRRLRDTPELLAAVAAASGPELAVQTALRRQFSDELVRAALLLHELRIRAREKFTRADQMWFDRQGLEQATSEAVARHKARRFSGRVWDLCCGIGGDALALAARGEVVSADLRPAACLRTEWNAEAYGVRTAVETVCRDVTELAFPDGELVHIDPDRRSGAVRSVRIADAAPGLDFLRALISRSRGGAIKLSPAADFGGKFPGAEIELVSLHGECKEATVWFGELAGERPWRATALPSGETLAGDLLDAVAPITPLGRYLYDPDPAVVRSGLLDLFAEREGLSRLDREEEYLTGDALCRSAFVQTFEVLAVVPNNLRALRSWFRNSRVGQLEIKRRRIPVDIEKLRRELSLPGDEPGVLIVARIEGKARGVVCRRLPLESRL